MGAVDDAKKYLSLRPPMENKTIFALHPDVLVAGLLDEIERLREEVKELEEIMEENKCAVGYLITKRVLKQHGMWKEAMEATRQILRDDNV